MKSTEHQKQIKIIIYYIKFRTSTLIVKDNTNFPDFPKSN